MTMPLNLVLVRHGESEGNVATGRSRKGDDSDYTDEFRLRHSSLWRLTDRGREQAKAAGEWLRSNIDIAFGRYYASEYLRAVETAMLLDFPNANWYLEFYLRERDWGDMDVMTFAERKELYGKSVDAKKRNPFYWTPPNGVSMPDLCLRWDRVADTLHRECSEMSVVMVNHGDLMRAARIRLERLTEKQFLDIETSRNPYDEIHNCQILHYTRINPVTGEISSYLSWMRSVCPWDLSLSSNEWRPVMRRRYSNDDLREMLERAPRLVN